MSLIILHFSGWLSLSRYSVYFCNDISQSLCMMSGLRLSVYLGASCSSRGLMDRRERGAGRDRACQISRRAASVLQRGEVGSEGGSFAPPSRTLSTVRAMKSNHSRSPQPTNDCLPPINRLRLVRIRGAA